MQKVESILVFLLIVKLATVNLLQLAGLLRARDKHCCMIHCHSLRYLDLSLIMDDKISVVLQTCLKCSFIC
uniref:Uncharacterized protein n=1 Tax=Arundo donax TaxID=35708 RepID=A0A0A9FWN7_ARUDO